MSSKSDEEQVDVEAHFRQHGGDFVTTASPRLLIQMHGCREVFVNLAHEREFGPKFPVVRTPKDISRILKLESRTTVADRLEKDSACYCYPTGSPVSISHNHCVFDRSFGTGERVTPYKDIACFLESQDEASRKYKVYRCVCQTLRGKHASYLDAELLHMMAFEVVVRTEGASTMGQPIKLSAETTLRRKSLFRTPSRNLSSDSLGAGPYATVFQWFADEVAFLKSAVLRNDVSEDEVLLQSRAKLLARLRGASVKIDYHAVSGFIHGIYGSICGSAERSRSLFETVVELMRVQARFFDVFILHDVVVGQLPKTIKNW